MKVATLCRWEIDGIAWPNCYLGLTKLSGFVLRLQKESYLCSRKTAHIRANCAGLCLNEKYMSYNLLKGKRGVIFGALNEMSIAWKVAERAVEEGAIITLSNTPVAVRMGQVDALSKKLNAEVLPADATNVEDLEKDGLRNWLLNTFSVNNLIHESYPLKQRILFEDIPSGRAFLTPIIEAMREGRIIRFLYQSYWWNEPKMVEAEPYCVKVFKQRWYVVVRNRMHEALRIYALDRIHSLDLTDVTFEYPADFDPQAYFDASFGIIVDKECEIEAVQIKVYNNQSQYLRALPLHHTQKEIAKTDDYSIFEYILRPTYDFKQELLSHGDDIEVLSPAWLREEIKKIAGRMYRRYR